MTSDKTKWKWVIGMAEGKIILLGPYPDDPDTKAEEIALDKFDPNNYEIVKLTYYGKANATSAIKHMRLENTTLQEALERVRHRI